MPISPRWVGSLGVRQDAMLGETIARHVLEAVDVAEGDPRLTVGIHTSALLHTLEGIHGKNVTGIVLHLNTIAHKLTEALLAGKRVPGSQWLEDEGAESSRSPFSGSGSPN